MRTARPTLRPPDAFVVVPQLEKRAIERARRIPVSNLDPGLPRQPLLEWLAQASGPGARIEWEMNDCGEQTGDPKTDAGRDFPLCIDVIANLSASRGKGIQFESVRKLRDLPAKIQAPQPQR